MEKCELQDVYKEGLPGLHRHRNAIEILVTKHLPNLQDHFTTHQVKTELYVSDWILTLFLSTIPESESQLVANFISLFLTYKWEFFYKLVLSLLEDIEDRVLDAEDMFNII